MLRSCTKTLVRAAARPLSSSTTLSAAQVFRMPAMSPTMTEGGIVGWKLKAGESFAAGDVLLEVETDKATIDVEAQDDGVMWEVLLQDGASGVPVGKPIAILAEPGDDLATLEKPDLEEPSAAKEDKEPPKEPKEPPKETKSDPKKEPEASLRDSALVGKADPAQKLTPAVEMLLHSNGISAEDAFAKIQASGPKGRLLRGDVMAYLGQIDSSAVQKVAEYIHNKQHLDLSNIKIAEAKPVEAEAPKDTKPAEKPKPTNVLTIEFTSELGADVSREKFRYAFEKALENAKRQTYGSRFPNYARSPISLGLYEDDIFDDLLVAPVSRERFQVSGISYQFFGGNSPAGPAGVDAFDELLGLAPKPVVAEEAESVSAVVSFQVKFDANLTDSKEFVEFFQNSLLSQIPLKQLIIHQ